MATTGVSDVAYFLPNYYSKLFLDMLNPTPVVAKYAMKKPLPTNNGITAYFPRMTVTASYPTTYKISTDGTVITPEKIVDEQVAVSIKQWGNAKAISDLTEMTAIDSTTEETIKDLANQANNLLDKVLLTAAYGTSGSDFWGTAGTIGAITTIGGNAGGFTISTASAGISGTTGPVGSTGGGSAISSLAATDCITAAALRRWIQKLKARNVQPLEDGYFAFICHTDTAMKLLADSNIGDLYKYTDPENLKKGVVGRYAGAQIQEDNNILVALTTLTSTTYAYFSLLLGRGGLGATELDGGVKTYIEKSGGTSDPIHQFMTFGWKANFNAVVLNQLCGLICVSAGDNL